MEVPILLTLLYENTPYFFIFLFFVTLNRAGSPLPSNRTAHAYNNCFQPRTWLLEIWLCWGWWILFLQHCTEGLNTTFCNTISSTCLRFYEGNQHNQEQSNNCDLSFISMGGQNFIDNIKRLNCTMTRFLNWFISFRIT